MGAKDWTEEKISKLQEMWLNGKPARYIASELGAPITRNAVISKVMALGIYEKRRSTCHSLSVKRAPTQRLGGLRPKPRSKKTRCKKDQDKPDCKVLRTGQLLNKSGWLDDDAVKHRVQQLEGEALKIPVEKRCGVMDLTDNTCRWSIGDPASEEYFFCGKPVCKKANGARSPYCADHTETAYHPQKV